ncbi:hypothetical protein [Kribbella sp. NPDC003557]|uniref:hypothetical protein n=1 Tax=Kribbella sp. NPDC003557 TaxID=3154449 RepID=UPI0033ADE888
MRHHAPAGSDHEAARTAKHAGIEDEVCAEVDRGLSSSADHVVLKRAMPDKPAVPDGADPGDARQRVPATPEGPDNPREPDSLVWNEPVVAVPRLQARGAQAEPRVTVTIGRIEIVEPSAGKPTAAQAARQAAAPQADSRAGPRRRTTSTPDLAAYLRSRSGR